jgi:hypothetical protein
MPHGEKKVAPEDKSLEITSNREDLPTPPEVLKDIPADQQDKIKGFIRQQSFSMFSGQFPNPLFQKFTSEHVTSLLHNSDEADKRDREERKSVRRYDLLILVLALLFVGFLVVFLVNANQFELLKYLASAILGFAGGFGVGKYQKKDE